MCKDISGYNYIAVEDGESCLAQAALLNDVAATCGYTGGDAIFTCHSSEEDMITVNSELDCNAALEFWNTVVIKTFTLNTDGIFKCSFGGFVKENVECESSVELHNRMLTGYGRGESVCDLSTPTTSATTTVTSSQTTTATTTTPTSTATSSPTSTPTTTTTQTSTPTTTGT